jgi:competence protein ComGF
VFKRQINAFTLIECLIAIIVMTGTALVVTGLSQAINQQVAYYRRNQTGDWQGFVDQLTRELDGTELVSVDGNYLYVLKGEQGLRFGRGDAGDFRKTNWSGQGYQPMLFGITSCQVSRSGQMVRVTCHLADQQVRTFVYRFEEKNEANT